MKKSKIFFIATVDIAINAFLLNHLKVLSKDFDITVIVNTDDPLFLVKQGLNIKVIRLRFSREIQIFSDITLLICLIYIFIMQRPFAVHSITPKAGLLAMLAAFVAYVPFRAHTFTGQVWATKYGFVRFFLKSFDWMIARLATFNIVDSASQQRFLINEKVLSRESSIVFGLGSVSGVDLKRFIPSEQMRVKVRLELEIPSEAFVFIYLGRLNQDKGIIDLASAFAKIQNSKAFLLVVGPDEGGFVDKIKIINIHKSSQVRFVDFTDKPEDFLAASDALCLPSYREGFGNVIIEAAAMGIPAIASNIYGISDAIINEQTGLLHIPRDLKSIMDAMEHFLTKPELVKKYGDVAMERVKTEFDANTISKYWRDFYLKVLGQR